MNVATAKGKMKKSGTVEEWENIARRVLADPKASRSEVDCALTGITQSENTWLREQLQLKRKKAWIANVKQI